MQHRAWRSGRETVSYQEEELRCNFTCTYANPGQPQMLYLGDRCTVSGIERKLSTEELARIEERLRKFLTEKRVFGIRVGTQEVRIIREQSL